MVYYAFIRSGIDKRHFMMNKLSVPKKKPILKLTSQTDFLIIHDLKTMNHEDIFSTIITMDNVLIHSV